MCYQSVHAQAFVVRLKATTGEVQVASEQTVPRAKSQIDEAKVDKLQLASVLAPGEAVLMQD